MAQNNIKDAMNSQGRTQVFLQSELGKSRTTIYNWYNNISQPNIFELRKISDLLNISMNNLVEL